MNELNARARVCKSRDLMNCRLVFRERTPYMDNTGQITACVEHACNEVTGLLAEGITDASRRSKQARMTD